MISIIKSPFVSLLKMIQTELVPVLHFNSAQAQYGLCCLGSADIIRMLNMFFSLQENTTNSEPKQAKYEIRWKRQDH